MNEQIIFFPHSIEQTIFFANLVNKLFFYEKTIPPSPGIKWSAPYKLILGHQTHL